MKRNRLGDGNADGNGGELWRGAAKTSRYTYDAMDRLTQITYADGSAITYTYDANGNQTGWTDSTGTTTESYDSLNRLVQEALPGSRTVSYNYDNAGNLTGKTDSGGTETRTYNGNNTSLTYNAANELSQAGTISYTHDANGNMTGSSAGLQLAYNTASQTTSITAPGGTAVAMGYSNAGQTRRVSAGSTSYQYEGATLGLSSSAGVSTYFTFLQGAPLSERTPGGTYYYLHDALNSVVAVTDSTGAIVNSYSYDPYGNTTSFSEQVPNPFRWRGAVWDSSTQLYKLGGRYYSPSLGRFTQLDPGGSCQSLNGYTYAAGDPINKSDPSGYWIVWHCWHWTNCQLNFSWSHGFTWSCHTEEFCFVMVGGNGRSQRCRRELWRCLADADRHDIRKDLSGCFDAYAMCETDGIWRDPGWRGGRHRRIA